MVRMARGYMRRAGWLGCKTGEREKTVIDVVGGGSLGGYRNVIGGVGGDVITRCGSKRWVLRMFAW